MILLLFQTLSAKLNLKRQVPPNPPVTVPQVDIQRYLGVWYQQAVIPYFFQRDCTHTTATYTLEDKDVRVNNTCVRKGKPLTSIGTAQPQDSTNAKLAVRFYPLAPPAQYWIVRLASDYSYVAISDPHYQYLWVLSRQKMMNQTVYNSVIRSLQKDGFPVDELVRTDQS